MVKVYPLGQVGYLFDLGDVRIVIDPYLTDSVADQFGESLRRMSQPTLAASEMTGVAWVLLTHAHLDHADPASLAALAAVSPAARFIAPYECMPILAAAGIALDRIKIVTAGECVSVSDQSHIRATPAAHTALETDASGRCRYLGYYITTPAIRIFHAGDTIAHEAIFESLNGCPVDYAFLPVNECNYFRAAAGIVGNMTPREAFGFAERICARTLVPTHWDLFASNSTFPWELEALFSALKPDFQLRFLSCGAAYHLG